jgi:hypothetical protein
LVVNVSRARQVRNGVIQKDGLVLLDFVSTNILNSPQTDNLGDGAGRVLEQGVYVCDVSNCNSTVVGGVGSTSDVRVGLRVTFNGGVTRESDARRNIISNEDSLNVSRGVVTGIRE